MKCLPFVTALLIGLRCFIANAEEPPSGSSPEDLISKATFMQDGRLTKAEDHRRSGIGLVHQDMAAQGIAYDHTLSPDRSAWAQMTYQPEVPVFLPPFSASPQMAYAEIKQLRRVRLSAGIDQTLHATENKYWGFLLGLGMGLQSAEYETTSYPQLCTWFCGYDPRYPQQKKEAENFAFLSGRMGVSFRGIRVFNEVGELAFVLEPILANWPQRFKFIGPDGRHIDWAEPLTFTVRASIDI